MMTNLIVIEDICVGTRSIDQVMAYKYLDHEIRIGKDNQTVEILRRIRLTWAAFGKLNHIFKSSDIPICLKRKSFNQCVCQC
ncbi:unnamed protein product [Diabrotica balteata]|uniref:Uncharacterized protein n=1 Tax=Diabrotica balteata TaxID=107213 RepID=A0A9N9SKG4_DIABA|nr:unnamed protein product [Diabrotica balteata]